MKCKGTITIKEVPLINLLRAEDLKKLNLVFRTNYRPLKVQSTARVIMQVRHQEINDEIDKLMRQVPKGGGYGI